MIEAMGQVHMTEAEVASDLHGVLAKVQQGVEVVVKQDHRPVAVIRSPLPKGDCCPSALHLRSARFRGDSGRRVYEGRRGRALQPQPAMEPTGLGVILDSSVVIEAERQHLSAAQVLKLIVQKIGEMEAALCSITVAFLVYRFTKSFPILQELEKPSSGGRQAFD